MLAAVVLLSYVAYRCTASVTAWSAAAAIVAATGVVAVLGRTPLEIVGTALLAVGLGATSWALGRSARLRGARRRALAAYRSGEWAVPGLAAASERHRLAADLHDTAAHRLTGIMIGASSALHVADPRLKAEASAHAATEGRLAVAELTRLTALDQRAARTDLAEVDALVAEWPGRPPVYRRSVESAPPLIAALAFRVVREALTNCRRYAHGARVEVGLARRSDRLVVTVDDWGRAEAGEPFAGGCGSGLSVLRADLAAAGGSLSAGRSARGWSVRAELPLTINQTATERPGGRLHTWALVGLAAGIPVGGLLIPGAGPPLSARTLVPLLPLLVVHALALRFHTHRPVVAVPLALSIYPLLVAARWAGWPVPSGGGFLWSGWVELIMMYGIGAARRLRSWPAPAAVAVTTGAALAWSPEITGNRVGVWAVLSVCLLMPMAGVWAAGVAITTRRAGRHAAAVVRHHRLSEEAAQAERARIAARLRSTALLRAQAVVAAVDLETVMVEARAGLDALRDLLDELRSPMGENAPPPCLAGITALAARHEAVVRFLGEPRQLQGAVEATAFWVARELLSHDGMLVVSCLPTGVMLSGMADAGARRRLRAVVDAADGGMVRRGRWVRIWLPEVGV
ncbi:ATP-binding protein [Streptosporangium sp. NPDC002544]|uniref:sensor histidine kinase n=1 Tax=Streptosporangium sp. NPDC002544 TaxID=3154538 RepID=UPI003333A33D